MVPYYSPYLKIWDLTPKLSLQHAQKPSYSAEGLQDTQNTSLIFWAKIGVFLKDRSSKRAQNSLHMSKACRNIERDIHLFSFALTHLSLQAIKSQENILQKTPYCRFWARNCLKWAKLTQVCATFKHCLMNPILCMPICIMKRDGKMHHMGESKEVRSI